jgi:hypothetical protein
MVLGTIRELKAHAALMHKFPEMEHADPNQASVEPGKTSELVWQFTKTGRFVTMVFQVQHAEQGWRQRQIPGRKGRRRCRRDRDSSRPLIHHPGAGPVQRRHAPQSLQAFADPCGRK